MHSTIPRQMALDNRRKVTEFEPSEESLGTNQYIAFLRCFFFILVL